MTLFVPTYAAWNFPGALFSVEATGIPIAPASANVSRPAPMNRKSHLYTSRWWVTMSLICLRLYSREVFSSPSVPITIITRSGRWLSGMFASQSPVSATAVPTASSSGVPPYGAHTQPVRAGESAGANQAIRSIFGHSRARLAANSPLLQIARAAPALRAAGTRFWFYSGSDDRLLGQNRQFAADLRRLGIPHRFLIRRGGHNWALWRGNAAVALMAAARHLA